MGDMMNLPDNMTEEDVLEIVRELCGDDMTDEELKTAYRSGMFQELCPDIEKYASERAARIDEGKSSGQEVKIKVEKNTHDAQTGGSKEGKETKTEVPSNNLKATKIKEEADSESESVVSERHSHHHKKKKKKHSKDHKRRDKDKEERKDKHKSRDDKDKIKVKSEPTSNVVDLGDSSDSENEKKRKWKEEKSIKEKRKRLVPVISSSDSDSGQDRNNHKRENSNKLAGNSEKRDHADKNRTEDNDSKPKVHPFYQDRSNDPGVSQPSTSKGNQEVKAEKVPDTRIEPRPFTRYSTNHSKVRLDRWRPTLHKEHLRYQRKFRLKPISVVCVDLLDFPMVFHDPRRHKKNPNAIPLSNGVNLSDTRLRMIRSLERDKANWYRKKINRKALKFLKASKNKRYSSSDDDDRKPKRARIMDRIISSSGSNSDSSSVTVPNKKPRKDTDDHRDRKGGRLSKVEKEAEAKRRKIEELKKKVDKFSSKGTRVLPWENKDTYFKNVKKKDAQQKEKEKLIAEKKKKIEQQRKEKLEQQKNAPSVSFQRILKQIESANKEQAAKPRVELKIPKKSQTTDRPIPISEYKLDSKIGVGDVYNEVKKLLSNNVLVECPVMPEAGDDLGEYTVKKIAWWILKNEKNPPIQGLFHPECHDDEDYDSDHDDDFDWPSDVSSITGCVSDPEGIAADIPPDPRKVGDPDWADDYCGEASLYARFRKETKETKEKPLPIDSTEPFKTFLRVKPGTNYAKPNFEVKCFVCTEVLKGQRQFGAHIRSDSHKNNFRNYSLDMANYEEKLIRPTPKKVFVAQLVEYSNKAVPENSTTEKSDLSEKTKHQVGKIEHVRSDSPGPIVDGDGAPNVLVHQMPIPDDISFASIQDYDISSDESLMNVKVVIRTAGKWNDDLERRWRTWRDEEAKIAEEYNGEREYFINEPQRHPCYQEEWLKFWDQRCLELEAEGKDTENYNFDKEWQPFWFKRMQEIMKERVEVRVAELKKSLAIEKQILRSRYGISAEATKRQKKKKKAGKLDEENSSSFKTSDKVDSNGHGPPRQPMVSTNAHQRNQNNVHSKPACLPTPPITDENRERGSINSNDNDSQILPNRETKSKSHEKHEKRHKSRNDKNNDTHHRSRSDKYDDKHRKSRGDKHKAHRDERDKLCRSDKEPNSSQSIDNPNSRSNSSNVKNAAKSVSSISSVEPPPPGNEPLLLGKAGRPPPPVISERFSNQVMEINKRIESELNEKLSNRNQSTNSNSELISRKSKPHEKSDKIDDKSNEPVKSKHVSSWSCNSSDEERVEKRPRRDSGGSSGSSYSKTLQSRLQALREALADDEAKTTKKDHTERPKVIPLESTNNKRNLSDGEVASDISDLDININTTKGVSTFVNKKIPGLADLDKPEPSTSKLDKNSLGYHLLERQKSADDHQTGTHSDRPKTEKRDDRYHHHKDQRHGKDKSHSSRHEDRNRHKNDYRGSKDDKHRRNNSKDNYNHHKDSRGHVGNARGGGSHDNRNPRDLNKQKKNKQPPFKSNPSQYNNSGPPPKPRVEESWETEDSWGATHPTPSMDVPYSRPLIEESWEPAPSTPTPLFPTTPIPAHVPENTCQIPVLDSVSRPPHQPYNNNNQHHQGPWNGGWGGNQAYPHDPNNYYNY